MTKKDIVRFLDYYSNSSTWCLATIEQNNNNNKTSCIFKSLIDKDVNGAYSFIDKHNGINNMYFLLGTPKGVPNKKPKKSDMQGSNFLWCDIDPNPKQDLESERRRIYNLLTFNRPIELPSPTFIIDSGRGYWGFWELKQECTEPELIEAYNKKISKMLGGDSCHSIEHIGRLPGTINTKTGNEAKILDWRKEDTYAISDMPEPDAITPFDSMGTLEEELEITPCSTIGDLSVLDAYNVDARIKRIIANGIVI